MALGVDTSLRTRVPGTPGRSGPRGELGCGDRLDSLLAGETHFQGEARGLGQAPEFPGFRGWLNSEPLTLEELRGKVVLIDFWTYSCVNCIRTLLREALVRDVSRRGLVVVGSPHPEFAFERERTNVEGAVDRLGIPGRAR